MAIFPANATLVFQQPVGGLIESTGTPTVGVQPLILVASVRAKSLKNPELQAGIDFQRVELTGRCITPFQLPNDIEPGAKATCQIWRLDSFELPESFASVETLNAFIALNRKQITQEGEFFLKPEIGSRFRVQEILGDKLEGHLTSAIAWDEIL